MIYVHIRSPHYTTSSYSSRIRLSSLPSWLFVSFLSSFFAFFFSFSMCASTCSRVCSLSRKSVQKAPETWQLNPNIDYLRDHNLFAIVIPFLFYATHVAPPIRTPPLFSPDWIGGSTFRNSKYQQDYSPSSRSLTQTDVILVWYGTMLGFLILHLSVVKNDLFSETTLTDSWFFYCVSMIKKAIV